MCRPVFPRQEDVCLKIGVLSCATARNLHPLLHWKALFSLLNNACGSWLYLAMPPGAARGHRELLKLFHHLEGWDVLYSKYFIYIQSLLYHIKLWVYMCYITHHRIGYITHKYVTFQKIDVHYI